MRPGVDVYLLPAVVGGGLGDVEQVLSAGRHLARAGFLPTLYRTGGRPLPPGVDGPWAWPALRRGSRLRPTAPVALTIASSWGLTAEPPGPGAARRPGPWSAEVAEIERAYGPDRAAHVSLEEFARTLTPRAETVERFREGGVRSRAIPARLDGARKAGEIASFEAAYRAARALDRPNVLPLYTTFRRSPSFARAFPETVQAGPLWPGLFRRSGRRARPGGPWVWYASPASSERIFPAVAEGLARAAPSPRLFVRAARAWPSILPRPGVRLGIAPLTRAAWHRRFAGASLRIGTGSRSLLEALELGGPFLYFNGVLGRGAARRRHRPEKIRSFLAEARRQGWASELVRDLADFARGRRVAAVVARAAERRGPWGAPFPRLAPVGFRPPFDDAGTVLVELARSLARPGAEVGRALDELRRRSNR
jgi:hypothetical protein